MLTLALTVLTEERVPQVGSPGYVESEDWNESSIRLQRFKIICFRFGVSKCLLISKS